MALVSVNFRDGKIVGEHAAEFVKGNHGQLKAVVNGWNITVLPVSRKRKVGKIICHFEQKQDGAYEVHREFNLQDGTLSLSTGRAANRHAFFHSVEFQNFLGRFGLQSVKHENPNQEYTGIDYQCKTEYSRIKVFTDGTKQKLRKNPQTHEPRTLEEIQSRDGRSHEDEVTFTITGASWVVCQRKEYRGGKFSDVKVLYTNVKDIYSLEQDLAKAMDNK